MPLRNNSHATLASELATAREKYESKKESVLGRAQKRLAAVNATRDELGVEARNLDTLIRST